MNRDKVVTAFLVQSESLLPAEFYDVRQEIAPKAGWGPMYTLAAMAYIGAIVAFATIYTAEIKKTYTDTIIVSKDQTGQDGYTCQMISKVTADYEIASQNDPALAFELVNVIESRSQYEANYASADPCGQSMTFFPGDRRDMFPGQIVEYGAVAMYGSDVAMFTMQGDEQEVVVLEYNTGVLYTLYVHDPLVLNTIAAADGGVVVYVTKTTSSDGGDAYVLNTFVYPSKYYPEIYTSPYSSPPRVLSDNLYNSYLLDGNTTFSSLDLQPSGGGNSTAYVIFTVPSGQVVHYAAAYTDVSTGATRIYFSNQHQEVFAWEGGVITAVRNQTNLAGLAVDGEGGLFYMVFNDQSASVVVLSPNLELVVVTESDFFPAGFAVTVAGDRAVILLPTTSSALILFSTPLDGINLGYNTGVVNVRNGDAAGYFTCGDQLLNDSVYSIGSSAAYPTVCRNNGVVAKVVFYETRYQTFADARNYVLSNGEPHCTALYEPVGDVIADLPPYSCSRTIRPSFLACVATAAANTQLLFQILVFFSAALLTRLAPRFPPKRATPIARPDPSHSIELADLSGNGSEKTADIPMANKSTGYHP